MMRALSLLAPVAMLAGGALALAGGAAGAQGSAGEAGFSANCAACHQENGKGIEGAFPALAANALLLGPEAQPIAVVLNGRNGMPNFKSDLTDDQIAQILTYARSAWGNAGAPVTAATVAAERAKPNQ